MAAMRAVSPGTLFRVALQTLCLQAAFSNERRQGLGVAGALSPLARVWPESGDRSRFLLRHLENFNTNPAMAGPLLGAVCRLEEQAAAGEPGAVDTILRLKRGAEAPFASAGDTLVWGGVRPGAALWGGAIALLFGFWGPVVFLIVYNAVHLGLRLGGVFWGYAQGERVLQLIRSTWFRRGIKGAPWVMVTGALVMIGVVLGHRGGAEGLGIGALATGVFLGHRGYAHGTTLALGGMIVGLVLALILGSSRT